MPNRSKKSAERLATCDTDLNLLFDEVLLHWDHSILDGHREEARQNQYYKEKKSKLKWPNSKHNRYPSRAADVAPYPIDWDNRQRFLEFRGVVYAIASRLEIKLNKTISWDLCHWELRG